MRNFITKPHHSRFSTISIALAASVLSHGEWKMAILFLVVTSVIEAVLTDN